MSETAAGRRRLRLTSSSPGARSPDGRGSASRRMDLVRCAMLAPELVNTAARIRATAWIDKLSVTAGIPGRGARIADPYIELLLQQLEAGVLLAPFDVPVPDGPLPRMVAASATHMRGKAGRHSPGRKLAQQQGRSHATPCRAGSRAKSARGTGGSRTRATPQQTPRHTPRHMPQQTPQTQQGDLLERRLMASMSPKRAKPTVPTELIAETARWVVQNGKEFEGMLKETNRGNPLWTFLLEPQSAAAQVYRDRLQHERRRRVTEKKAAAARARKKERDAAALVALEREDKQVAEQIQRKERAKQRLKVEREEEMAELVARKRQEQAINERLQREEQAQAALERKQADEEAIQRKAELRAKRQRERVQREEQQAQREAERKEELLLAAEATAELLDRTRAEQAEQQAIVEEVKAVAMDKAVRDVVASLDKILQLDRSERPEDIAEREAKEETWKEELVTVRHKRRFILTFRTGYIDEPTVPV